MSFNRISRFASTALTIGMMSLVISCSDKSTTSSSKAPTGSGTNAVKAATANKPEVTQKVEKLMQEKFLKQNSGLEIQSISCPNDIKIEAGYKFDCQAKSSQGLYTIAATVTNAQGDMDFNTKNVLLLPSLEKQIKDSVKQKNGVDIVADCGSQKATMRIVKKLGESFQCKLTPQKGGKSRTATITVKSEEGQVNIKW